MPVIRLTVSSSVNVSSEVDTCVWKRPEGNTYGVETCDWEDGRCWTVVCRRFSVGRETTVGPKKIFLIGPRVEVLTVIGHDNILYFRTGYLSGLSKHLI